MFVLLLSIITHHNGISSNAFQNIKGYNSRDLGHAPFQEN